MLRSVVQTQNRNTVIAFKVSPYVDGETNGELPYKIEVFTAVTMKVAVFWDVTSRGSCKNRHFGGTYYLHHQGVKNR
jgi:hypothetical protein